jgi:hypothetical protein
MQIYSTQEFGRRKEMMAWLVWLSPIEFYKKRWPNDNREFEVGITK